MLSLLRLGCSNEFLSSNAQDFIEERIRTKLVGGDDDGFLSSNAQDFIEEES